MLLLLVVFVGFSRNVSILYIFTLLEVFFLTRQQRKFCFAKLSALLFCFHSPEKNTPAYFWDISLLFLFLVDLFTHSSCAHVLYISKINKICIVYSLKFKYLKKKFKVNIQTQRNVRRVKCVYVVIIAVSYSIQGLCLLLFCLAFRKKRCVIKQTAINACIYKFFLRLSVYIFFL